MKLLAIVLFAVLAVTSAELNAEEKTKVQEFVTQCVESSHVDKDLLKKLRAQEFTGHDAKLANYCSCLLGKMKFQKEDGSFDQDEMIAKMPGNADHETGIKAVKKCALFDATLIKDDNALKFVHCFYKNVGKEYVFLN